MPHAVGAALQPLDDRLRARVHQHEPSAQRFPRPGRQPAQVGQVPDAPAVLGASGVELDGPTPCRPRRQLADARAHDQSALPTVLPDQRVVTERHVRRQAGPTPEADLRAVLQAQRGPTVDGDVVARTDHEHRTVVAAIPLAGTHRLENGIQRGRRRLAPGTVELPVPLGDSPRSRVHPEDRTGCLAPRRRPVRPEALGPVRLLAARAPDHRR
jgi:hypothetical protein